MSRRRSQPSGRQTPDTRGKAGRGASRGTRDRAGSTGKTVPGMSGLDPGRLAFGPANYAAFLLGLVAIVGGYVMLDRGSVTAAPILLIVGYAVLLPLGLILGWRRLGARRPGEDV